MTVIARTMPLFSLHYSDFYDKSMPFLIMLYFLKIGALYGKMVACSAGANFTSHFLTIGSGEVLLQLEAAYS